jgi:hypothetical protein
LTRWRQHIGAERPQLLLAESSAAAERGCAFGGLNLELPHPDWNYSD